MAVVEGLGHGLMNIPSAFVNAFPPDQAGTEFTIAMDPRQAGDVRFVAGLQGTRDYAFALTGLGEPATPATPTTGAAGLDGATAGRAGRTNAALVNEIAKRLRNGGSGKG